MDEPRTLKMSKDAHNAFIKASSLRYKTTMGGCNPVKGRANPIIFKLRCKTENWLSAKDLRNMQAMSLIKDICKQVVHGH